MFTGFVTKKTQLTLLLAFGISFGASLKATDQTNNILPTSKALEEKTDITTTIRRTILKSIIESSVATKKLYDKKQNSDYKQNHNIQMNYGNDITKEIAKCLVDEICPNPKSNFAQKFIEFVVPEIISFTTTEGTDAFYYDNKSDKNISDLSTKLASKLLTKFVMVRGLQKPGTASHKVLNTLAIFLAFYQPEESNKTILDKLAEPESYDLANGVSKVILDTGKNEIQAVLPFKKNRSKCIAKILQILAAPHLKDFVYKVNSRGRTPSAKL